MSCCPIGKHPKRAAIEAAIASGDDVGTITARYLVTTAAVAKHRAHMAKGMAGDTAAAAPEPTELQPSAPEPAKPASTNVVQLRPRREVAQEVKAPAKEPAASSSGKGIADGDLENAHRRCVGLLDALEDLIGDLRLDASNPRDLLLAYKELRESITLLARLTREIGPEREIVILQSPKWKAIEAVIFKHVGAYPDLAAAMAKDLEEIEAA